MSIEVAKALSIAGVPHDEVSFEAGKAKIICSQPYEISGAVWQVKVINALVDHGLYVHDVTLSTVLPAVKSSAVFTTITFTRSFDLPVLAAPLEDALMQLQRYVETSDKTYLAKMGTWLMALNSSGCSAYSLMTKQGERYLECNKERIAARQAIWGYEQLLATIQFALGEAIGINAPGNIGAVIALAKIRTQHEIDRLTGIAFPHKTHP